MGVINVRGAGKANTVVLAALVIILKVTCLLLTSKLKANSREICSFLPLIPNLLR